MRVLVPAVLSAGRRLSKPSGVRQLARGLGPRPRRLRLVVPFAGHNLQVRTLTYVAESKPEKREGEVDVDKVIDKIERELELPDDAAFKGHERVKYLMVNLEGVSLTEQQRCSIFSPFGGILQCLKASFIRAEQHPIHFGIAVLLYVQTLNSDLFKTGVRLAEGKVDRIGDAEYREFLRIIYFAFANEHDYEPITGPLSGSMSPDRDPILLDLVGKMKSAYPKLTHSQKLCACLVGDIRNTVSFLPSYLRLNFQCFFDTKTRWEVYGQEREEAKSLIKDYAHDVDDETLGELINALFLALMPHEDMQFLLTEGDSLGQYKFESVLMPWLSAYPGPRNDLDPKEWVRAFDEATEFVREIKARKGLTKDQKRMISSAEKQLRHHRFQRYGF